ncbi:MAG: hypothetical protein ACYC6Y_04955 [Thermoguttaceae bacterium]
MSTTITGTAANLPQWAADILASPPARGGGLNRWLLRAAIALRRCGRSEHEIQATLAAATADQPMRHGEIERAVERSAGCMSNGLTVPTSRNWTTENEPLRRKIIAANPTEVVDLWERSPYRLTDDGPNAEQLINLLFPGDPLLCCASKLWTARTTARSWWRGKLSSMQFIVPSPMSAETGMTQDNRPSPRCLGNTGPRRFLVVEQDSGTPDDQAAILLHLAQYAPLVMALTSGGKSLHGWFSCKGASEQKLKAFFKYAVMLGADPATWTPCQLVRMPEGRRDNGNQQAVLFLNREAI